jgi:hypothetical protein
MLETLYGRTVILDDVCNESDIIMHPDTWERIKKVHYRSAVQVTIVNPEFAKGLLNGGEEIKSSS